MVRTRKRYMRNTHPKFPGLSVGTRIKIIDMAGEPHYAGKTGTVTHFDSMDQCHGTWGIALQPRDSYVVLGKEDS